MLEGIAQKGTQLQKELALNTLKTSELIRARRRSLSDFSGTMSRFAGSGVKERIIYDAQNGSTLPGAVARSEGDIASPDLAVNEAYDGSGVTYDLYKDIFNRDSIDGKGMRLDSTIHFRKGYDNAFWDGQQMVYGDGDEDLPEDERLFNRFTIAVDIIGHELTHGVTQFEAKLAYSDQSGALSESMSDVFGSLVKQRLLNQTVNETDWIIGAGLLTANVNGAGIRSMSSPGTAYDDPVLGKDPQPAHMRDYVTTTNDNGGVHINSGIPNYAFHRVAMELGGHAWAKAGQIWYAALRDELGTNSNFQDCANMTLKAAINLYGSGSIEEQAVKLGWLEVGLNPDPITLQTSTGNGGGCLEALLRMIGAAPSK